MNNTTRQFFSMSHTGRLRVETWNGRENRKSLKVEEIEEYMFRL